jgi:hypothetical protein
LAILAISAILAILAIPAILAILAIPAILAIGFMTYNKSKLTLWASVSAVGAQRV